MTRDGEVEEIGSAAHARARLVEATVDAQWRWYRLTPSAAQPLIEWLCALERSY